MQNDLKIISERFKATMSILPYKVGVLMVGFTRERFKYQNWLDTYPESWKQRKENGKWKNKKNNKGRALLVQTGRLRRSIRIVNTTSNSVTIGSDVPYASAHNDGVRQVVTQQVGAYKRRRFEMQKVGRKTKKVVKSTIDVIAHDRTIRQNIPRRRFMGESKFLTMQITRLITAEINKTFK